MQRLRTLSNVPSRAATPIAKRITDALQQEFEEGRDPYGRAWRPLKAWTLRRHGPPPLTDTGRSRAATVAVPKAGKGVAIRLPEILVHHQFGYRNALTGKKVGPRPVLPVRGMPRAWKGIIDEEVAAAFRSHMSGGAR